jgi:predicted transcriptional regulator
MILSYIIDSGQPQTPASIASALPIPRERAKKALQRMAKGGQLQRTKSGYTVL